MSRRKTNKAMKGSAVILGVVLGAYSISERARAQAISDGSTLKDRCATVQLINPSAGYVCRGYVGAIADVLAGGNKVDGYRACPPEKAKRDELVQSVKSWLDRHPDRLH